MKIAIQVWLLLAVLSSSAQQQSHAGTVRVPDAATALKIAEPILDRTYGKKLIESEKPLTATLTAGVWTVDGTLWCDDGKGERTSGPGRCVGGVAQLKLRQRDGKLLSITHTK
ncbi:MAG: NTF2 fold immunity protein [Terracidiphilus sp.]